MNETFGDLKPKILVVDDVIQNVELLKAFLLPLRYNIEVAYDGKEALLKVEQFEPDLILLDVMLPKIDGYEVCKKLKSNEKTRNIMVIMITALSSLENEIEGVEAGADDYLTKPFKRLLLQARIKSLLKTKYYNDELEKAGTIIESLALGIEAKDTYTIGHCERLSYFSVMLAQEMKLHPTSIEALRLGGSLHDIGKLGIPDAILLKQGPLTHEEREIMKKHSIIGENICKPMRSLSAVIPIIRHHHEKCDGTGYPDRLTQNEYPITARILQIVDVYDSLLTKRPYKPAYSQEKSMLIMEQEVEKDWWDKEIFSIFKTLVEKQNWYSQFPSSRSAPW